MGVLKHAAACRSIHFFKFMCLSALSACSCSVCTGDIAAFFVRRPRSACHVERTFSLMGHIQTKDRLRMGNNTLRHLAMMCVNKPTADDPDGESDESGPTVLCMLSLACEFNFQQKRRYPHVQVEACRSMPRHKKFFRGTAHAHGGYRRLAKGSGPGAGRRLPAVGEGVGAGRGSAVRKRLVAVGGRADAVGARRGVPHKVCGVPGAVLKNPDPFLLRTRTVLRDSPRGPPTANRQPPPTANRQPPTANRHQPPPTANRQPQTATHRQPPPTANHQPPTANRQPPPTTANRQPPPTATNRQPPTTANRQPLK